MSLLGIDVGTTGCKVIAFSQEGRLLAAAYEEYDVQRLGPGWAELDALAVWQKIKKAISNVAARTAADPVRALAVSSLGEAMVPVTTGRQVIGPSILNFDARGEAYLEGLRSVLEPEQLYQINGNTLENRYSLTKLMWVKERQPALYEQAHKFLLWGGFVSFMLGAEPVVDFSLANRTLMFDINLETWSETVLSVAGIEPSKLSDLAPSGTAIGKVSQKVTKELGLPRDVVVILGAHDQCANALGCGAAATGQAACGLGTYACIAPVFSEPLEPSAMIERGLNTEHHAIPGQFVTFIYNHGGSLLKWFRDTFAAAEARQVQAAGQNVYADLIAEAPGEPSGIVVLPHFAPTGPPEFVADSSAVIAGLRLETSRGEILKGILESTAFYLRASVDSLPPTGITIDAYRVAGGGSKSDVWVQLWADIMGRPFVRPWVTEAGALGAAIAAGVGSGAFSSFEEGVEVMVSLDRCFEPNQVQHERYEGHYDKYKQLWPLMKDYLRGLN